MKKESALFFAGMTAIPSLLGDDEGDHVSPCIFDCEKKKMIPCETISILAERMTNLSGNSYKKMKTVLTHEPPIPVFDGHTLMPFDVAQMKLFRFCVSLALKQPREEKRRVQRIHVSLSERQMQMTAPEQHFAAAA